MAYNGIIGAISKGNEEMVDKAIDVAVQESARYFAEGIARIEKARAYIDRVMYQYAHDPDCVAFKWKLSSPIHAMTCATCTHTDLWGMDEGSFQNDCCHHAGKAPMALQRRGSSDFSGIPKHMWER